MTQLDLLQPSELIVKPAPDKWSKKEILGHLIDSAIHNLKRFTEIQFEPKPYKIENYKQAELVIANNYQKAEIASLKNLWLSLNSQILHVMKIQTTETLSFQIELKNNVISDLRFLMVDYVDHLEHHVRQFAGVRLGG